MPEKNIADVIQEILEKNKGFVNVKNLPSLLSSELRLELGLKIGLTSPVIRKKIEPYLEDRFIFHKKGVLLYILIPCEPSELVISAIKSSRSSSPKMIAKGLPFTKKEFLEILNSLIEEGSVKLILTEDLDVKILFTEKKEPPVKKEPQEIQETPEIQDMQEPQETQGTQETQTQTETPEPELTPSVQTGEKGGDERDYSPLKFREAFYALDKGRIFVRICDLRRKLNWPREVFDEMLRKLRDDEIIQLHEGDSSTMTPDENNDCFSDENNIKMGTVTWNVRK